MESDLVAVLVGGTLVTDLFAATYYAAAARQFGKAHIMSIPGAGITDSVQHAAERLGRRLERDFPGSRIAACCHSQSGLELAQCALDNPNIVQVAAIGTPFGGTPAARLGWPLVRSTVDMLPGSAYLRRLHQRLPELTAADRLATISLRHDRVVPWPSSRVDGARNYLCATSSEYAAAQGHFPDTRHIAVSSRWSGHIMGLHQLEPELIGLLGTLWQHAQQGVTLLHQPSGNTEAA